MDSQCYWQDIREVLIEHFALAKRSRETIQYPMLLSTIGLLTKAKQRSKTHPIVQQVEFTCYNLEHDLVREKAACRDNLLRNQPNFRPSGNIIERRDDEKCAGTGLLFSNVLPKQVARRERHDIILLYQT